MAVFCASMAPRAPRPCDRLSCSPAFLLSLLTRLEISKDRDHTCSYGTASHAWHTVDIWAFNNYLPNKLFYICDYCAYVNITENQRIAFGTLSCAPVHFLLVLQNCSVGKNPEGTEFDCGPLLRGPLFLTAALTVQWFPVLPSSLS